MPLTPQDVRDQRFRERRKGYDVDEVDAFLERVTQELAALLDEREALRADSGRPKEEPNELLARTLVTAQRAADETLEAARAEAEQILAEANARAEARLDEAQRHVERERAALDAESTRIARAAESLAHFKSEYRGRVKAVIAEQLALLERAGELPDVPPAVAELASSGLAEVEAREAQKRDDVPHSALDAVEDEGHALVPPIDAGGQEHA